MYNSDPFQSGYLYNQHLKTTASLDYTYCFSEETRSNSHSRGVLPVLEQGLSMSRGLSNGSHSSNSTCDAISPQTPNTAWNMDSSEETYYYGDQNTDTGYNTDTGFYNADYTATTVADDGSSWYQSGSYSTGGYYPTSQSESYTVYVDDTSQSNMGTDSHRTASLATNSTSTGAVPSTSTAGNDGDGNGGYHMCLVKGCDSKTLFKRKADLQRHYQHRHMPNEQKKQYFCDYKKCARAAEPFHRVDHFRDHYRDFHNEDLTRKTGEKPEWYESRNVSVKWWRCAKCLGRTQIAESWVCGKCGSHCDANRRALRGYS